MILSALSISTLFTFVLLPLGVLLTMAIALIPCLFSQGAKVGAVIKALYCYLMQSVGAALMTAGALPAVYGVLEKFSIGVERFSAEMYLALLIVFSCGGILFLWHEQIAERIDDASRRVPALLFWYTFKALGMVLFLVGLLSTVVTMLLTRPLAGTWWLSPVVILLYGALLSWCTRWPRGGSSSFQSMPIGMKMAHATKGKKK